MTPDERPGQGPSDATRAAIRAAIMADLAPARSMSLARRALVVLVAAVAAVLLAGVHSGMEGLSAAAQRALLVAGIVVAATVPLIASAFAPARGPALGGWVKGVAVGALIVGWIGYLGMTAQALAAASAATAAAAACAGWALGAGIVVGVAGFWAFRFADPWTPGRSGAVVGAAAGCIAGAGLGIGCGSPELGHLLAGHGLIVPLLAGIGAIVGRRVLRP